MRLADLRFQRPIAQGIYPIKPVIDLFIMGHDNHHRSVLGGDFPQHIDDDPDALGVKCGCWLVGQDNAWIVGEALAMATRWASPPESCEENTTACYRLRCVG